MKRGKEDYLRVIYELYGEGGVRNIEIAEELQISKSSVTEMIKKLAKENFVKIKPYSKIQLTRKGSKHGEKQFNKHLTIKEFIKKMLKHPEKKALEEAHRLEHALSFESVKIIEKLLNRDFGEITPDYVG